MRLETHTVSHCVYSLWKRQASTAEWLHVLCVVGAAASLSLNRAAVSGATSCPNQQVQAMTTDHNNNLRHQCGKCLMNPSHL